MYRTLTHNGHPINTRSFFIGIKRGVIQSVDFVNVMNTGMEVLIPVHFLGKWEKLKGVVRQVNQFPDGMLVVLKPSPTSLLENWLSVEIWISSCTGHAGVLS